MASRGRLTVAQSRRGRRPMRISTLLRKEKEGTLYKEIKLGGVKLAEPPPPKGVPASLWDKRLDYGPDEHVPTSLNRRIQRLMGRKGLKKLGAVDPNPSMLGLHGHTSVDENSGLGLFLRKLAYKLQGHTEVQDIPIAIENRKGSVRKGKNADGTEWRTEMKNPYGYLVGTKGADGDPVDAYVGSDKDAPNAYVVHQHKDDGKGFDEDKVMLGFKSKGEAQKAFLKHYDDPKFLGPTSTVPVEELKEKIEEKKKLVKISALKQKVLKRGEDDPYPRHTVESRHDNTMIQSVGEMLEPDQVPKYAEDRALGDQRRSWEGPTRGDVGTSLPEKLKGPGSGFVVLNDISPAISQDETKTSAMFDELSKLGTLTPKQLEVGKLVAKSDPIHSPTEAEKSLKKLKRLEESKKGKGELFRGMAVGSTLGPLGMYIGRTLAGRKAMVGPVWRGPRDMAASALMGGVYGSVIPTTVQKLERGVEKQKLREYVGQSKPGTLRSKIKRNIGV